MLTAVAVLLYILGAAWMLQKPEVPSTRLIPRIFYGVALAMSNAVIFARFVLRPEDTRDSFIFAGCAMIGCVSAFMGTRRHGHRSWADVFSFVITSFFLAITTDNVATIAIPMGSIVGFAGGIIYNFNEKYPLRE